MVIWCDNHASLPYFLETKKLKGWILFKHSLENLKPDAYEIFRLLEAADSAGIEVEIVTPEMFDLIVTRDGRQSVMLNGKSTPLPDFFLPRMGSGTSYFALSVIRHMERLGVHVVNKSSSIENVKDKLYTQQILAASNLPVPKTMLVKDPINVDLVESQLGFPVVVKTLSGSKGNGVYLSENKEQFTDVMELVDAAKTSINFILQEFIATSRGRDLRVIVIGGRAVACMERFTLNGSFKANYSRGADVRAFEMTPEIEWLATETAHILELDIAGIDLLFDGDHFKVCEANSAPGFKGMEQCVDIDMAMEMYQYIRVRLGSFDNTVELVAS